MKQHAWWHTNDIILILFFVRTAVQPYSYDKSVFGGSSYRLLPIMTVIWDSGFFVVPTNHDCLNALNIFPCVEEKPRLSSAVLVWYIIITIISKINIKQQQIVQKPEIPLILEMRWFQIQTVITKSTMIKFIPVVTAMRRWWITRSNIFPISLYLGIKMTLIQQMLTIHLLPTSTMIWRILGAFCVCLYSYLLLSLLMIHSKIYLTLCFYPSVSFPSVSLING